MSFFICHFCGERDEVVIQCRYFQRATPYELKLGVPSVPQASRSPETVKIHGNLIKSSERRTITKAINELLFFIFEDFLSLFLSFVVSSFMFFTTTAKMSATQFRFLLFFS